MHEVFDPHQWAGYGWWVEFLVSLAYGSLGAVIPIFNAEAYAVAAAALAPAGAGAAISGLTLGQTAGKMVIFYAVRQGRRLPIFRKRAPDPVADTRAVLDQAQAEEPEDTKGVWRRRWDRAVAASLRYLNDPRWAHPVLFLAGLVGFPPLYLVVVAAAASRMNAFWFAVNVTVGRLIRFVLLGWGGVGIAGLLG